MKRPIIFLKVFLCFLLCRILVCLFGFQTQMRILTGPAWKKIFRSASQDPARVIRYTDIFVRSRVIGFKNAEGCFVRALVLFSFFQTCEPGLRLVIGMRKDQLAARGLDGHAWLEKNGQPWQDILDESSHFDRIFVYP